MNNPLRILQAVDVKLDQPIEFFLFGRAALVLGFADPPAETAATQDVDGIIPRDLLAGLQANERWWTALEAANDELEAEGLYLTHLFDEEQIILRANWQEQVVNVACEGLRFLQLRRPTTIDLVLTKMMRGTDPEPLRMMQQDEPAKHVYCLNALPSIWEWLTGYIASPVCCEHDGLDDFMEAFAGALSGMLDLGENAVEHYQHL